MSSGWVSVGRSLVGCWAVAAWAGAGCGGRTALLDGLSATTEDGGLVDSSARDAANDRQGDIFAVDSAGDSTATDSRDGPSDSPPDAILDASPDLPDGQPSYRERVKRACVIASSCIGPRDPSSWDSFTPSHCMDAFSGLGWEVGMQGTDPVMSDRLLQCATGPDCASFLNCFGGPWLSLSRCWEGASCEGDVVIGFGGDLPFYDCTAIGSSCMALWSGAERACCNAQPCIFPTPPTCNGTVYSRCGDWGDYERFDCAVSGRICSVDPMSPCVGTGPSCSLDTPVTCVGSVASYCSGGTLATMDCSSTLFRTACAQGEPGRPCRPAGGECDPETYHSDCQSGDEVTVCVDGHVEGVSCSNLGFQGCTQGVCWRGE